MSEEYPRLLVDFARFCPECLYAETDNAIRMARFDYLCPRCGKAKLSEFLKMESLRDDSAEVLRQIRDEHGKDTEPPSTPQ